MIASAYKVVVVALGQLLAFIGAGLLFETMTDKYTSWEVLPSAVAVAFMVPMFVRVAFGEYRYNVVT